MIGIVFLWSCGVLRLGLAWKAGVEDYILVIPLGPDIGWLVHDSWEWKSSLRLRSKHSEYGSKQYIGSIYGVYLAMKLVVQI